MPQASDWALYTVHRFELGWGDPAVETFLAIEEPANLLAPGVRAQPPGDDAVIWGAGGGREEFPRKRLPRFFPRPFPRFIVRLTRVDENAIHVEHCTKRLVFGVRPGGCEGAVVSKACFRLGSEAARRALERELCKVEM